MFYLQYAWRNLRRGGRWTALAIFCIAAGVASVVALRGLGLAIGDSLVNNVRIDNKGDIRLVRGDVSQFSTLFVDNSTPTFSDEFLQALQAYIAEEGGAITAYADGGVLQIAGVNAQVFGRPSLITTYYIDPTTYPLAYEIRAQDPPNTPLSALFTGGNDVVISRNMADTQRLKVGDTVTLPRTEELFTVRGIVGTENEAGVRNLLASFFGFAYVDLQTARAKLSPEIAPNSVGISFPQALSEADEQRILAGINALSRRYNMWHNNDTARRLLERNAIIAQILGDFIVVMGLGALLIGGVGIMNTMLVLVRRRTNDIATLKTFGLKGRQVAMLFLTEGALFGVLGSALGCVFGVLLGGIVNSFGETFLQQSLAWKVYPEALAYGFALGMVTTVIFSLAPILTALQVRPATILRPNETVIPRLGCIQTLLLMVVVVLSIGAVVGQIVSPTFNLSERTGGATPYISGVIGVAITLAIMGVLVMLLWLLVWLIGKMPSFGSVSLKLALRNLSVQRTRTATTLLALSAGMFALSSIVIVGEGTRELLQLQLTRLVGGNVLAIPLAPTSLGAGVANIAIRGAVSGVQGVRHITTLAYDTMTLEAIDGVAWRNPYEGIVTAEDAELANARAMAHFGWGNVVVWDTDKPDLYDGVHDVVEGRNLTLADRAQAFIVGSKDNADLLGIRVGSVLTYNVGGRTVDFTVVGLTGGNTTNNLFGAVRVVIPPQAAPLNPFISLFALDVAEEGVNETLARLSAIRIPPTFAIDVTFIDSLITRFIAQFSALPTIVGVLSLGAAAVIMANTVALSILERRRQIGVLKAVGLKSGRVLRVLLLETGIISLVSAILGVGLSALGMGLVTSFTGTPLPIPTNARLAVVLLVGLALLIGWGATFISANVAVRERVMNVLRYE